MESPLRCAHQVGPVDLFGEVDLGAPNPIACNALAFFVDEDGAPCCAHPKHGKIAPMAAAQLTAQSSAITALLEHARPAVADAHAASLILLGARVSMADIEFCSPAFRQTLMAVPMATLREQAAKVVAGIADEVLASERVPGLCNALSGTGELCSLPAEHPRALGDAAPGGDWHATFRVERTTFRGWSLPDPDETGWTWTSKRDGLWFSMGPGWMTKVLPRPLGYHARRDLGAIFSGPEAICQGVLDAIRSILPRGARMGLSTMVEKLVPLTGWHPLPLIAAVMTLNHRGQLCDDGDLLGWPEDAAHVEDDTTRTLTDAEARLLLRAGKTKARAEGVPLTARTLTAATGLRSLGLGTIASRPNDKRMMFTISEAGLARSGRR